MPSSLCAIGPHARTFAASPHAVAESLLGSGRSRCPACRIRFGIECCAAAVAAYDTQHPRVAPRPCIALGARWPAAPIQPAPPHPPASNLPYPTPQSGDPFVMVPNVLGMAAGAVQLALFAKFGIYRGPPKAEDTRV